MTKKEKMKCPECGIDMNHHADKIDYSGEPGDIDPEFGGMLEEVHSCPNCGRTAVRVLS